jgi:hypothetical protein
VTGEAGELRRRLGPTAWVVFEELLLASTGPATACCASVSVRSLAASSGLAKDTVARALVRLRAAGLVAVTQSRSTGGVFAASNYELRIPPGIVLDDSPTPAPDTAAPDDPASITRPTTRPTVDPTVAVDGFAARPRVGRLTGSPVVMTSRRLTNCRNRQVPAGRVGTSVGMCVRCWV